ncbi:hypothetical protein AQ862_06795 [Burkholderia pseudomallei]|nr:hypothetical protein AQ862_06795 [Burkholderia pseudomallei]
MVGASTSGAAITVSDGDSDPAGATLLVTFAATEGTGASDDSDGTPLPDDATADGVVEVPEGVTGAGAL